MQVNIFQGCCQIWMLQHVSACLWLALGERGWIVAQGMGEQQFGFKYAAALYFMFCQLGFGSTEIEPTTADELVFCIAASFAALLGFSSLLAAISGIALQLSSWALTGNKGFKLYAALQIKPVQS